MSSDDEGSDVSDLSADETGFFNGLDPSRSYRLTDAYEDEFSSGDEANNSSSSEEDEEEVEPDMHDGEETEEDEDEEEVEDDMAEGAEGGKAADMEEDEEEEAEEDTDADDESGEEGGKGQDLNEMFQDDDDDEEAPEDPEEESEEEEGGIKELQGLDEADEGDSDSDTAGTKEREMPPLPEHCNWRILRLSRAAQNAVAKAGFLHPTPIQAKVIRPALNGMDICARAVTGSGKTAAFSLPLIERLRFPSERKVSSVRGLVLEPTREIAFQAQNMIRQLALYTKITTAVVSGGVPMPGQIAALKQPVDIAIATPGRLIDLLLNHGVHLNDLEMLVLDESDKLLGGGFSNDIKEILRHCPEKRQTMQFSATMTRDVDSLANLALKKPLDIDIGPMATAQGLRQEFIQVKKGHDFFKPSMLALLCTKYYKKGVIVFCSRRDTAHMLYTVFDLLGIKSAELHGKLSQGQRLEALKEFRERTSPILFTTDLAQRGLDFAGCRTVINYDMPYNIKAYIHRVGRTARMGRQGVSVSFIHDQSDDKLLLEEIIKLARVNNAAGKVKKAAVPVGVKNRRLDPEQVEAMSKKLNDIDGQLKDRLKEEEAAEEMDYLEKQLTAATNRIEHEDEIQKRPKKAWHLNIKEKKKIREAAKIEEEGANMDKKRKREHDREANKKVAKYQATDLDNRPIKGPMFTKKLKEEKQKEWRKAAEKAQIGKRAAEKLTNRERKAKKKVKRKDAIAKKKAKGVSKEKANKVQRANSGKGTKGTRAGHGPSEKKLRIKAGEVKKGKFKSASKYRRR